MCADARARGVPCTRGTEDRLLPQVPCDRLPDFYTHVSEIGEKIKADLKALGCWQADPRASMSQGVMASTALGRGVEATNWHNLQTSWHRWSPDRAPMPLGTSPLWRQMLTMHEMELTTDKSVLWKPESWLWNDTPTWYISGVSTKKTSKVCTRS